MSEQKCKSGGKCSFDKRGVCVKCGYDYAFKRIKIVFSIIFAVVFSFIIIIAGLDISILFPQSFLSAVLEAMLNANKFVGFLGHAIVFYWLIYFLSPLFLMPYKKARDENHKDIKKIFLLDFFVWETVVGWIFAMYFLLKDRKNNKEKQEDNASKEA